MTESNGKRPCLKLSSIFTTFPDPLCFSDASKSPKSAMDNKKSPRNFEGGVVGLGIVAAMNESNETHDPFSSPMSARAAKAALSPRSVPIPIVSSKTGVKLRGPMSAEEEMELSESYTCVISHVGNEPIRKHEYFERTVGDYMENFGPPKIADCGVNVPVADFLSSCNLCRKNLQGLDIFMYRGEKAFCSAECRRQQILSDEHREKCGTMLIANAGDCRAVLGKRGRAVELSRDHKPNCSSERLRIEKLGGIIYDGYLCGQLSVARALGDWHMKGAKGSACPLSAEPELQTVTLTVEDEFLIMGCDGLWDVMSSQCAVTIVRKELMQHNNPERCSWELVREALKRNTCDNLTVIVICFSPDPPPRIEIPRARMRSISADSLNFLKGVLESNI